ncbi:uncharacterized protein PpBr36_11026 [Pyricularia pennisetigena]|uniref:uncharacterized protein n=1 Tax=Pyricularia pennisetigena TaxID=1578925 RepID=UPI00114DBDD3|nr:uncharacterized protein PpBr36_11026 [Pyricularia pennisetigena]TLS20763.1 hypothetical protein PpBr36_11026 [Pyricularia pennisetigena]
MEGISKKSAATSNQFRFLIGPEKREYTIHSHIVAEQSAALETTVHGEFREANDGFVTWDDIDERTFLSFWHHAYTGDYDDPEPVVEVGADYDARSIKHQGVTEADNPNEHSIQDIPAERPGFEFQPEEVTTAEPEAPSESFWGHLPEKKAKRKRIPKREMLWNDFQKSWRVDMSIYVEKRTRRGGPVNHADISVHHCRVYVLADRYDITRLMNVSFNKLHHALVEYDLSEQKLNDIVELLRFCYAEAVPEKLRQLVVHYASCNAESLWKSEEFQELLEDYGNLGKALVRSLLLRLD